MKSRAKTKRTPNINNVNGVNLSSRLNLIDSSALICEYQILIETNYVIIKTGDLDPLKIPISSVQSQEQIERIFKAYSFIDGIASDISQSYHAGCLSGRFSRAQFYYNSLDEGESTLIGDDYIANADLIKVHELNVAIKGIFKESEEPMSFDIYFEPFIE